MSQLQWYNSRTCCKLKVHDFLLQFSTLQETNISPENGIFEDDFPFPQVGYVNPLEGTNCETLVCETCRIPVNGDWNTISMPFANLLLDLNDFLVAKTWIRRPQKIVRWNWNDVEKLPFLTFKMIFLVTSSKFPEIIRQFIPCLLVTSDLLGVSWLATKVTEVQGFGSTHS